MSRKWTGRVAGEELVMAEVDGVRRSNAPVMREDLARAVRAVRGSRTQDEMAGVLQRTQSYVSDLERGTIRLTVECMVELEEATGHGPGTILRQVGYLTDIGDNFEERVRADALLDEAGIEAVVATYRACIRRRR